MTAEEILKEAHEEGYKLSNEELNNIASGGG